MFDLEHAVLSLRPLFFTQRPLDDRKIEPAKGRARLWLVTSFAKSIENFVLHGKKKSLTTASFFLYFREIRNKWSHWPGGQSAPRLYNRYNLHMCQARTSGRENSGSQMVVLRFTTLSAWDRHWRNPRKKNYREHSNIKPRVSVHWQAQCHAKWPRGSREFQHSSGIEPKSPRHSANLLSIHLIAFDIDWSWNNFSSHNFCSIAYLAAHQPWKSENWELEI